MRVVAALAAIAAAAGLSLATASAAEAPVAPALKQETPGVLPAKPESIRIGALGVAARVVPVEIASDGTLAPPADPALVGWWSGSVEAGARRGATLLTGHAVFGGDSAFGQLGELRPGDAVAVGPYRYAVESVEHIPKDELPGRARELFGGSGRHRLVMVTCDDRDPATGEWNANTVVVAAPLPRPRPGR